jgi:branched-chain amino acid transport system permease protein
MNMGFNLLFGLAGQISMGQPAFFALAAYSATIFQLKLQWPAFVAYPASLLLCAVPALVLGIPVLRLRTHYLAMATLSLLLILGGVAARWTSVTGGTGGIAVPPLQLEEPLTRVQLYYAILTIAAIALFIHDFVARSHIGRALRAMRDDETSAAALGIDVTRYKLRVFVLAAVFAGTAGLCYSQISMRLDPAMMDFGVLVGMLTVAAVGGLGTRFGPILGTIFIVLLPQLLARFGEIETLVYGVLLLLSLIFMPRGLAGMLEGLPWGRWFGKRSRAGTGSAGASLGMPVKAPLTSNQR